MSPGRFALSVYRGDTPRWSFTLWADPSKRVPIDLTTVAVAAQIRTRPAGTLILALAPVVTLPNTIAIAIAATDSATLPASAAWDMQLTYASGDVVTVLAGPVNAVTDVTRAA